MDKPAKNTLQDINRCLNDLVNLGKGCINTELPIEMRQRGAAILNNLFLPSGIDHVTIDNLTEQLFLLEEIKLKKENKPGWFNQLSQILFKKEPILAKHWGSGENKNTELSQKQHTSLKNTQVNRNNNTVVPSKPTRKDSNVNYNHTIDNNVNREMRSRKAEKRLDASPNPYAYRDQNKNYGSSPSYDDQSDTSFP